MLKRNSIYILFLFLIVSCENFYNHQKTGIEVCFKVNHNMFPASWLNSEIHPHAKSLPVIIRPEAKKIILNAFHKYPKSILYKNLEKVYLLKELKFYGVEYGGTNTHNVVYIVHNYYSLEFVEIVQYRNFSYMPYPMSYIVCYKCIPQFNLYAETFQLIEATVISIHPGYMINLVHLNFITFTLVKELFMNILT